MANQVIATGGKAPVVRPWWQRLLAVAAALAVLAVLPLVMPKFYVYVAVDILIFALFATSLNLMLGYGGMTSFGHAAYFGISAYTAALLYTKAGFSMAGVMVLGPVAALLAGLFFGFFCVRLTAIYFAMLTLAFAQATYTIIFQWYSLTQGDTGITGVWPPAALLDPVNFYYLTAAIVVVCMFIMYVIVHSPFGFVIQAIRENPRRVRLIGIDVKRYQLLAFAVSAFFSGVAGVLFVFERGGAYPDYAYVSNSIKPLVMTLLGGMHSFLGPTMGAVIFTLLHTWLTKFTDYWQWVLGLILIFTLIAFPTGVAGYIRERYLTYRYHRERPRGREQAL